MDAARAAVSKITGRKGHTTDVDEYVNPAVVSEVVKPIRHEEVQEAVDREVHQDHYHTTVQPIAHRETLPEKHVHNLAPQIEREFRHDNEGHTRERVQAELGQFKNTSVTEKTTYTTQQAATVAGEHIHHHVHETVQPVIHKETIQPEVIHTTVPIHEIHHQGAQHHGISALPMKTLDEFTRSGGIIQGSKSHTHEEYEGAPRPYNEKLQTTIEKVLPGHHGQHGTTGTTGTTGIGSSNTTGIGSSNTTGHHSNTGYGSSNPLSSGHDSRSSNPLSSGHDSRSSNPLSSDRDHDSRRLDSGVSGVDSDRHHNAHGTGKPSLMDKLNPRVDANGDGKPGFMK